MRLGLRKVGSFAVVAVVATIVAIWSETEEISLLAWIGNVGLVAALFFGLVAVVLTVWEGGRGGRD